MKIDEKKYKLALVGATGVVGQIAREVLTEKKLPIAEYVFFASSKSAGRKLIFMGKEYIVRELTETSFDEGFDFAIFSAGSETSKKFAPIATKRGCIVVDNSNAWRMEEEVPLIVPEVNKEEIKKHKGIIANPNCSTIQAVLPLKVLEDKYKIRRIVYATYQAVSGAGIKGISDLEKGKDSNYELQKFPYPIINNCLPQIDVFNLDTGYTKEEEKMMKETRKILNRPDLRITATAVRVPVLNSHSEVINVELEQPFKLEEIVDSLKKATGIIVEDDIANNIYPLATNASGHDKVYVGRIRRDDSIENGINLWVVADNLRKGAASNAVQIVEELIYLDKSEERR